MLQIAICDDDRLHLSYTRKLTEKVLGGRSLSILEFGGANELLFKMDGTEYVPDIALLDIQMPGVDGIELAKQINRSAPECMIIFVSSYIFYAPEVYDTEHIYFVLKSQIEERLPAALEKAVASLTEPKSFMLVKFGASVSRIPLEQILYLERALHKTRVVTVNGSYMSTQSPAELLSTVESKDAFIRCHQSYWVNARNIDTFESDKFIMRDGSPIPISRAQKANAKDSFFRLLASK